MKAALYDHPGGPEVLRCDDAPHPGPPGAGELLLEVTAISIEGGDLMARRSHEPGAPPAVIGYAAAGVVIAVGEAVSGFAVGDRVTTFAFGGSHASLRRAPAATSWRIPPGLDNATAAAIPCGPGTAAFALSLAGVKAGDTVLVLGATGGVGAAAVQLAHAAGSRVLAAGRDAAALEGLRPFGLDEAIVLDATPLDEQVRSRFDGRGVDVLVDNIGGPRLAEGLRAVEDGGRIVLVGVVGGMGQPIDSTYLLAHRLTVVGCLLGVVMAEAPAHGLIGDLLEAAARGRVQVPIDGVFPLSSVAAAHARAEARGRLGRVIIKP